MSRILDSHGNPLRTQRRSVFRELLAKYDAAQTTDDNMRHWSWADGLSADAANNPQVREKLRNRSRYEAANNSYCRGMIDVLAADVIGTGPRLQIVIGDGRQYRDQQNFLEREFANWCEEVKLAKKFRTMRKAKATDGEGVALLTTKMRLRSPVKLNVRPLETEMVASPGMGTTEKNAVDGIRFDEDGDPLEYDVLREHPGGGLSTGKADRWPAEQVLHLFREDRAGQHRGIPETTPALPLFSQLRRFTLATLAAAETAAEYAAVIETQLPADSGGWEPAQSGVASMDVFELAQRMVTVLPDGYKLNQVKPEHPATTYGEFKREILGEAFAALCMPFNVGAHDSSEFNYSSGKLDRLSYGKLVFIERYDWRIDAVLPVFRAWFDEAAMIPGYLPPGLPPMSEWIVVVHWDGQEDIDPVKAAQAREIELRSGQRTLEDIYAERGEDAETKMERQAQLLGMKLEDYQKRLADKLYGPDAAVLQQQQQEQQNERKERDNATAA